MRVERLERVSIELFDADVVTMREICRLAYERLHESQPVPIRGVPLDRQAGLVGPELFRVKESIEKIGQACGISLPYEPEPKQCTSLAVIGEDE